MSKPPKDIKKPKIIETPPVPIFQGSKMDQLQQLYDQWFKCSRCLLSQFRETPGDRVGDNIVFGDGNPDAKIMVVGEGPGENEEIELIPFVGNAGQLLNQILAIVSPDNEVQELHRWYQKASRTKENQRVFHSKMLEYRRRDFFITNVVGCRPPENRPPTPPEIKACFERLWSLIYLVDPWLIIACGRTALEALLGKTAEITKYRGQIFDVPYRGRVSEVVYPVMATFHPSYLLRKSDFKVQGGDFEKTVEDFRRALDSMEYRRRFGQDASMEGVT